MKKILKKWYIFVPIIIVVIGGIVAGIFLLNKKEDKKEDPVIEVSVIDTLTPLSSANSSEATKLVKSNIVKIVNKIDDKTNIVGTGFFDKSGYLVTNSHIVDIKGDITIEYEDGSTSVAQLYSNDITSDIALLAVENPKVKAMYYGDTLSLNITDDVYAIGYPFALKGESSVTKGILSARRSAGNIGFLQLDISLNTGNSGGPLINDKAELLGINTYATENASIGMSISSESLQNIIKELIDKKEVNYLTEKRPSNALSVVLNEIGYSEEDLYNEDTILKNVDKDNADKIYNDEGNGKNHQNSGNKNNKENQTSKKSSDATLSILSIDGYDIGFSSLNTNYHIKLKNQENELSVNAIANDPKSKVEVNGNSELKEGTNIILIKVTAEDSTVNEYKITVTKPITYLDGIAGILCSLDVQKYNGVNSFQIAGCDFIDSDRVRIYLPSEADIVKSVKIDVYKGWNDGNVTGNDTNGKPIGFLKSYTFGSSYSYNIPLADIRALLADEDYEGGVYEGADLTFRIALTTRNQGTFYSSMPWGLSK